MTQKKNPLKEGWEIGFLYYQQETGITTVVNFTSLPETRLVSRFFRRSSTTCVSSPYPAICQKDYSVTPRWVRQPNKYIIA